MEGDELQILHFITWDSATTTRFVVTNIESDIELIVLMHPNTEDLHSVIHKITSGEDNPRIIQKPFLRPSRGNKGILFLLRSPSFVIFYYKNFTRRNDRLE